MVHFRFCLVLAALCASSSLGASVPSSSDTVIIPVPIITKPAQGASEATTAPPNPEPSEKTTLPPITTTPSTTTSPSPTTTTAPPTTTTAPPTTTSATPTTTSPPPKTTTPPTTTSTAPPTPAPTPAPPAPVGPPEQGSWNYTNENNVTCIVVKFAAQLNVSYNINTAENGTATAYQTINVPVKTSGVAGGNCTGDEQLIIITWPADTVDNMLNLTYSMNKTTHTYSLKSVDVLLSADNFVNASSNASVELHHGMEWSTPVATSYRCMSPTRLNMTSNTSAAYITFSKLQEEAFRTASDAGFSAPRDCGGGDVPDAVPIAVGCALGGLVVVVLVAYLVGRRRSARGYLSM